MKKILIVEDDAIVASIYGNKLKNEGYQIDVATDGEKAIAQLKFSPPDLVILDLGIPKINGVEVLKIIRATPATVSLPVIVLSNSYLTVLIQAAWKAGANKCLSKADTSPRILVDVVFSFFATVTQPAPLNEKVGSATQNPVTANNDGAGPSPSGQPSFDALVQSRVRLALLGSAPGFIKDLRKRLMTLASQSAAGQFPSDLFDFYRAAHSLTGYAGSAGFTSVSHLCAALEALLKELYDKPKYIGASPSRTIAQAIDCLARLFDQASQLQTEERMTPLIMVLDDEAIARRTLCTALEKAHLRYISVDAPAIALRLLTENTCDLIFSDVEMPGLNGFEFCTQVRAMPQHKTTPLVFVTSLSDFESRARSALSGGTDLIAKPFLLVELAVKALIHVLPKAAVLDNSSRSLLNDA